MQDNPAKLGTVSKYDLDKIPLLWGLFILEESNCTSMIKRMRVPILFADLIV